MNGPVPAAVQQWAQGTPPPEAPPPGAPAVSPAASAAPDAPSPPLVGVDALRGLPGEKLTDLYKSGGIRFYENDRVPVRSPSGQLGTIDPGNLAGAVDKGFEIVPHDDVHRAEQEAKYGGVEGGIGAGLAGAARGLSVGLSDPALVYGAGLVGGDSAKQAMRDRLTGYKEVHPYVSAASEVAGVIAPAIASGGAAAGAEGAGLLARGVRGVGVLPEAISGLGRLAERGVAGVIGEGAEGAGLLSRAARKGLARAASGVAEGAAFGAGQEISEQTLKDNPDLTAAKLLASMGHGAVLGGVIGGGLGAAGEVASDALDAVKVKASPFLERQAGEQAWKATSPEKKLTTEARVRVKGGTAEVGRVMLKHDVIPTGGSLMDAAMTPEELYPRIEAAKQKVGQTIGAITERSGARIPLSTLNDEIEPILQELRAKAGWGKVVKAVEDYRDDLFEKLSTGEGAATPLEAKPIGAEIPGEVPAPVAPAEPKITIPESLHPDVKAKIPSLVEAASQPGKAGQEAKQFLKGIGVTWEMPARAPAAAAPPRMKIPMADLMKIEAPIQSVFVQKKALGDLVYREAKAMNPALRVEELREIYGKLADVELNAIDEAAKKIGNDTEKAALLEARHDYQALSLAERAAGNNLDRSMTNVNFGLRDTMLAGAAVASGHVMAAPVVAMGAKVARMRGNAFLAASYSRLSALKAIARRTEMVDSQMARGVRGFVDRAEEKVETTLQTPTQGKRIKLRTVSRVDSKKETQERYDESVKSVRAAAQAPVDATPAIQTLAPHAPQVAGSFSRQVQTGATWLATQVPTPPKWGSRTPSELEQHAFLTKVDAVDHPVDAILGGLTRGDLQKVQVDAVKNAQPVLYKEMTDQIDAKVRRMLAEDKRIPYPVKRDLALLFDMPTDFSMTPEGVSMLQQNVATQQQGGAGGGAPPVGPKRTVKDDASQNAETPAQRRLGGAIR